MKKQWLKEEVIKVTEPEEVWVETRKERVKNLGKKPIEKERENPENAERDSHSLYLLH